MIARGAAVALLTILAVVAGACGSNTENATGERILPENVTEEGSSASESSADDTSAAEPPAADPPAAEPPAADPPASEEPDDSPVPETPTAVPPTPAPTAEPTPEPVDDEVRCIVQLHGKGGRGGDTRIRDDGIVVLWPDGNGIGWGNLQWEYDTDAQLQAATSLIVASMDSADCTRAVVHGFSNGASMTAALHCSGNNLGGRLVGVIVDDPVPDGGTIGCTPATSQAVLYWTGGLNREPGTDCTRIDWTCAGGFLRSIDDYAADLGVEATQSPQTSHQWNFETPFPVMWLG